MLDLKEVARVTKEFLKMLPSMAFKPPLDDDAVSAATIYEATATRCANRTMIIFEDRQLSWQQFDALANQFAHLLKAKGVGHGDCVAVIMENRIELLACFVALQKLGAIAGMINTGLTGRSLVHCIATTNSVKCLVGEEVADNISMVRDELALGDGDFLWVADQRLGSVPDWAEDVLAQLDQYPASRLPETAKIRAGDTALYIFTSGTTGLPKAAKVSHRRYISGAVPYCKLGFQAKENDRMYVCLPLYHATGLVAGIGACFVSGASIFLRRKFSASAFWPEVQQYRTTLFVYVGELCRYLVAQAPSAAEQHNPLRSVFGNGLRPDIWAEFKQRFGIERIAEFYGSSEGNIGFLNILNKDCTIGICPAPLLLVKYDIDRDEIVRDPHGNVVPVKKGEPGLLLAEISDTYKFDGYTNPAASEAKLLRNVLKADDAWFNSGDLLRQIDVGFAMGMPHYQFVDRIGDTFRWRSENVSTNEVGEIINANRQVEIANVYGVEIPATEGKAGMVALTLKSGQQFDAAEFSRYVRELLPPYAQPVFVRIQQNLLTTGTFKLVKGELRSQAYHLDQINDDIYVMPPRASEYQKLDRLFYQKLIDGTAGY